MKKKILSIIAICVIVLIVVGVLWMRKQPNTVNGHVVTSGSYIEQLTGIGYVKSDEIRDMAFPVSGDIASILVEENMHVSEGDILAELDKQSYSEELEQAESNVKLANARYQDYIASYRQSANSVAAARKTQENQIEQIKLSMLQLETSIEQTETLYEEGIATEQELTKLREEMDTLTLRLDGATAQLNQQLYPAKTEEELLVAIESSKESLERTRRHEADYILKAPIDGIVGTLQANEGDSINVGETLLTIYDDGNRHIAIDVDESYLTYLDIGKSVSIYPDAYPDENIDGVIESIGALVDPDSGTVEVSIGVKDEKKQLLENMTARVVITLREIENVQQIPNNYLINEDGRWYVYKVDDNMAVVKQSIEIYDANRENVGIKEGLMDGDTILPIDGVAVGEVVDVAVENGDGL